MLAFWALLYAGCPVLSRRFFPFWYAQAEKEHTRTQASVLGDFVRV